MTARKLFLAGPMTGRPDWNGSVFGEAADTLRGAGYRVVVAQQPIPLRDAIRSLLDCDDVAVLDGWEGSRGALVEVMVAHALGMRVAPVGQWVLEQSCDG